MHTVFNFINRVRQLPVLAKNLFTHGAIVLLYHRVSHDRFDPNLLCVSPRNFESQLKFLKNNYHIYSYHRFIDDLKKQAVKPKSVLLTFDDGFADNCQQALPILSRYQLPAVIFVCGNERGPQRLWIQALENLMAGWRKYPAQLRITIAGQHYLFKIKTAKARTAAHLRLQELIKPLISWQQQQVIKDLRKQLAAADLKQTSGGRLLSSTQLKKLAASRLVTIGAHTTNHVHLASHGWAYQKQELMSNKKYLKHLTADRVLTFAYPFGGPTDYNADSIRLAERYFESAFSNFPGICTGSTDRYQVPRFIVRNWQLARFKQELNKFFRWGIR